MANLKVYSLKNCDTCKKALKWLDAKGIEYTNHDVRADGLSSADVAPIVEALGWETVINRRSTTWRGLDDGQKTDLTDDKAVDLILANPTLMKRPVFLLNGNYSAGFDSKSQSALEAAL